MVKPSISELKEIEETENLPEDSVANLDYINESRSFSLLKYRSASSDLRRLLSKEEVIELHKRSMEGDKDAFDILVNHNIGLVAKEASRYYKIYKIEDFDELLQEGILGLIRGIQKFDPSLGFSLSTYSTWWIRQSIIRFHMNNGQIRQPVHIVEGITKINRLLSEGISLDEIKERHKEFGINPSAIDAYINSLELVSLDAQAYSDEDSYALEDFVADTRKESNVEETVIGSMCNELLRGIIEEKLTSREKDIIYKRFGFYDGRCYTLEECAKGYNLTRERVRQIESKALRKLKGYSTRLKLEGMEVL